MTAPLWFLAGLLAGVLVGVMWREAFELIRGKDSPMALWTRLSRSRDSMLAVGLLLSMLLTGGVGITLMLDRSDRGDLVRCISDYNQQVGEARDSRNTAAEDLSAAETRYVAAELAYQRGLLRSLSEGGGGVDQLEAVIRRRVKATEDYQTALDDQTAVREAKPYPEPDLCEDPS